MDSYAIRVKQIKKEKTREYLKFLLSIILSILIVIGLYFLYIALEKVSFFRFLYPASFELNIKFSIIFFLIGLLCTLIVSLIVYYFLNKKYKRKYCDYLFNELKLDEIYIFEHKMNNNTEINEYIKKIFNLKKIKFNKSYSDASSQFCLDINNITYYNQDKKSKGILLIVHFDQERPGYLQLCKDNYSSISEYNGKYVANFGFSYRSLLKQYRVYSTYESATYKLEDNEYAKKIIALERFYNKDINLVFDNDSLYILIKDNQMIFSDNLLKGINNTRLTDKMEAIKYFHKIAFDIITLFDDLFITKV